MPSADGYSRESAAALRPLDFVSGPVVDETPSGDVRSVIVLVHGIRSHGTWMEEVKDALAFGATRRTASAKRSQSSLASQFAPVFRRAGIAL